MTTKRLIDAAIEHVRATASLKTVFGEPVRVDGKTFIPVAKVPAKDSTATGAAAEPIGVVEISGTESKYLAFGQGKRFAWIAGVSAAVGLLLGRFFGRGTSRKAGF